MDTVNLVLSLLIPIANIVDRDNERKYKERLLELKMAINEENIKPIWNGTDESFKTGKYRCDIRFYKLVHELYELGAIMATELSKLK